MLSTEYGFIFIHIPKTAGTSITSRLSQLPPKRFSRISEILSYPRGVRAWVAGKHEKALSLRDKIGKEQFARFFKFAVVRNPWDLMVSSYCWWIQNAVNYAVFEQDTKYILAGNGFDAFIRSQYGSCMINEFKGNMLDWLCDDRGNIIVDYIAKVEELNKDWEKICTSLGIPFAPLPRENSSSRAHYRDYYTNETKSLVAWRFQREIEVFKYEF